MDYKKRKRLKFYKDNFSILLTATYLLSTLVSNLIINKQQNDKDNINDLYQSISYNTNLDEDEKKVLDNLVVFLNDYRQYIDYNLVCDKLESFDIQYEDKQKEGSINSEAYFSRNNNKITLYNYDKEYIDSKYNPYNHELLHLISSTNTDDSFPGALEEGVTSIICHEYELSSDYYYLERIISYMLCEIVSSDTVVESYLKEDFTIIEKKLLEIDSDYTKIEQLKESLEQYRKYYIDILFKIGVELTEEEKEDFLEKDKITNNYLNNISSILINYYTKKTNKLVGNDEEVCKLFMLELDREQYSIEMSLFNSELNMNKIEFDENSNMFKTNNNFTDTTAYFNIRNKDKVMIGENGKYLFMMDDDNILKSSIEVISFDDSKEQEKN